MHELKGFALALLLSGAAVFASVPAVAAAGPNQVKCPVLGSPANKNIYTDYSGKRIYFCCPPCVREFKKDPDKYMRLMEKEKVVPENAPVANK